MEFKELIEKNYEKLSLQEKKVIDYVLSNINNLDGLLIKKIVNELNVQQSVITKSLQKVEIGGLKNLREHVDNSFYVDINKYIDQTSISKEYLEKVSENIIKSNDSINHEQVIEVSKLIYEQKPTIILFATGKTLSIVKMLYFTLIEYGYNVHLCSTVYDDKVYEYINSIVFVFSISGNNSKVLRFLKNLKNRNNSKIIAITSTKNIKFEEYVDIHLFGYVNSYFSKNARSVPMIEKYPILVIIDLIILHISQNSDIENTEHQKLISTKNII